MQANSIGIIGGADGPTAIFIATKLSPLTIGVVALAVVTAATLIFLFIKRS